MRTGLMAAFVSLLIPAAVQGQVNSWLKPSSGSWEEMQWSRGAVPVPGETVLIMNAGSKEVMISPTTGSVSVDSITLSSPAGSTNVLLLNYAGQQAPLTVNALTVASNSTLTMLSSALDLNGPNGVGMSIGGEFDQDVNSTVTGNQLDIGYIGPGVYNLISGTLSVGHAWVGGSFRGVFKQTGGTNATGIMHLDAGGEYDLSGGVFSAGAYFTGSLFRQQGGRINSGLGIWRGSYALEQGVIYGGLLVPAFDGSSVSSGGASVLQSGGTNFGPLAIGEYGSGSYTMSNGVSFAPAITVYARGSVQQWGGVQNVAGTVQTITDYIAREEFGYGAYTLNAGTLACGALQAGGHFIQNGGTNVVAGIVTLNGVYGDFEMYGGELRCDSVSANPSWVGGFTQTGGLIVITNQLSVGGNGLPDWSGLILSGGELVASNILLAPGAIFTKSGGVLVQSGLLTLVNADLYVGSGAHQFGPLDLAAGSSSETNSSLHLPVSSPCVVNFGDSSSVLWSNAATFTIQNWAGYWSGGGAQQIIFGTNSSGLSLAELNQVFFEDPAGFSSGLYRARILANGELVPDALPPTGHFQPVLSLLQQNGGAMRITLRGEAGVNYGINISSNLVDWITWTNLYSGSGTVSTVDADSIKRIRRFYRAVLLP